MSLRRDEANLLLSINGELAGKTLKGLQKDATALRRQLENMPVDSDDFKRVSAELQKINGQVATVRDSLKPVKAEMDQIRASTGGVGGAFSKLTAFAAAGVAGLAAGVTSMAVNFLSNMTSMGNSAAAMQRKTDTVFQESATTVRAFAEENANALGFTRKEFVNLATAAGDLLVPMGFTREAAADLSNELVRQGGVLSQWSGGKVAAKDATEILNKALLGERDALNSLGIDIKQSLVDQKLKEQGLKDLTGESLRQAEALVTLQLITEQSTSANEAFANGANKMAEEQAKLREITEGVGERMTSVLVPILLRIMQIVPPIVGWIGQFVASLGRLADASGLLNVLGAVFNTLGSIVGNLIETVGIFVDGITSLFEGDFTAAYNKFAEGFKKVTYTNGIEAAQAFQQGWKEKSALGFLDSAIDGAGVKDKAKKAGTDAGIDFNAAFANLRATGRKDEEKADKEAAKLRKERLAAETQAIQIGLEKELLALDYQLFQKTIKESDYADIVLSLKEQSYRDQLAALVAAGQAEEKAALDIRRKLLEIQQLRGSQQRQGVVAALPTAGLPTSISGGQQQVDRQADLEIAAMQAKFTTIYVGSPGTELEFAL